MNIEFEGLPPPMILPPVDRRFRYLWPGEIIPEGAEMYDWKSRRFYVVGKSIGTPMPNDPLHNSLMWIPVRVRAYR